MAETKTKPTDASARSKACLYLNKLADVDRAVLDEIVRRTYAATAGLARSPIC